MIAPITPEAVEKKRSFIPEEVFRVVNDLILEYFDGKRASVEQNEIVKRLGSVGLNKDEIFKRGWLDIEDHYRKAGWEVEYSKPAYNETFAATFTFKKKGK